ncbi:hypothetical protein Dd1591_2230 [Dickeya chrysanthemi Ech1591]|uniref:Uncharacterized protein n=1 Tax=Dickeya chrysanthemi (strain Ech1591) TaxID=561229 RepID=C6CJ92_DICC1|nr:hypothetical protein Dd1591_2230 [Dickeya chrysanthemi Ech1591]
MQRLSPSVTPPHAGLYQHHVARHQQFFTLNVAESQATPFFIKHSNYRGRRVLVQSPEKMGMIIFLW